MRGDFLARVENNIALILRHKSRHFKQFKMKNTALKLILRNDKDENTITN